MIKKYVEKVGYYLLSILPFFIFLIVAFFIIRSVVRRVNNPPSEIYGERQELNEWKYRCDHGSNDGHGGEECDSYYYLLKSKSWLVEGKDTNLVVAVIELDVESDVMLVTLRDWNSGNNIQLFPQREIKWYQLFQYYDTYETYFNFSDSTMLTSRYEMTVERENLKISGESCDSKGPERDFSRLNIQGGCFFIDEYRELMDDWCYLRARLRDGRTLIISL